MKTRLNVFVTAIILLLLSTATVAHAAGNLPIVNIGIVIDGPWERHPDYINIFIVYDEIIESLSDSALISGENA